MRIHRESVHHWCRMIHRRDYFSFAGYSDAEWRCVLGGEWDGTVTALGQRIDAAHGQLLLDVLRRRQGDPQFLAAVPRCLWPHEGAPGEFRPGLPGFAEGQVDWLLGREGITVEGQERDDVLDDLAADAGLFPWLREFQRHPVLLIGPAHLRALPNRVLDVRCFVEVSSPNLHLEAGGIDRAVQSALAWEVPGGHAPVYLVCAGVSAAVIADQLHDVVVKRRGGWVLDMGSVFDAFVRAGGQRAWRAALYADPVKYEKWVSDCLTGKDGRGW